MPARPAASVLPRSLRVIAITTLALLALAISWFFTASWIFLRPHQQPLHEADAIVSLAPTSGRLAAATKAFDDGLAPRLWVSTFPHDIRPDAEKPPLATRVCAENAPAAAETVCFTPAADSTIGEARAVAGLMADAGATSIIVTTHVSHAARTRYLFTQCLPKGTDIQLLLVDEPGGLGHTLWRLTYETGAFIKAFAQVTFGGCGSADD